MSPALLPETSDLGRGTPLLRVRDFGVFIRNGANDRVRLLGGVDFEVNAGEVVGLVGESGAGKTTLAKAILGLLPSSNYLMEGFIAFKGIPLLTLKESELRKIRGAQVSLVHQDSSVLNPVLRVGTQIVEVLRAHGSWSRQQSKEKAISLLRDLEVPDAERIYRAYPHQLSGGQRQRIALAQALVCGPRLLIADEPTSSLDAVTTREVLKLFIRFTRIHRTAIVLISHERSVIEEVADRVMSMHAGRVTVHRSGTEILRASLYPCMGSLDGHGLQPRMVESSDSDKVERRVALADNRRRPLLKSLDT
jgi:ABC-type glutathione transport system ATPase component